MLAYFKNHPFAVEAFFKNSLVLTFAIPKMELQGLIPECLELDVFQNEWAFIAVAMVQTKDLRPKDFPKIIGNDFFLIGYRIFVRYTTNEGKRLRGLYILKSETDKNRMAFFGNLFTDYNYTKTDIKCIKSNDTIAIISKKSKLRIVLENSKENTTLPEQSPFLNWKEARRYAGPLPFTFTYNQTNNEVLIIEGVRQNWKPKPIDVKDYKIGFLDTLNLKNLILANAFIIENIPYYWKKGHIQTWKQKEKNFKAL